MTGNVWEWTDSEHRGPYMHVLRGGSWRSFGKFTMRVTHTDNLTIDDQRDDLGFRCARSV
jgi:formylglycine-generating enzyme required for sulfatase activity